MILRKLNLNVQSPHWLSATAVAAVAVLTALDASASPILTPYDAFFKIGIVVFAALASPNVSRAS